MFSSTIVTRIVVILILTFAMLLGIYSFVWFDYVRTNYDPFIEALEQLGTVENFKVKGSVIYRFDDSERIGYSFHIAKPGYLKFYGNINVHEQGYSNEYSLSVMYRPQSESCTLDIRGQNELTGLLSSSSLGSAVDRDGKPLGRYSEESEERYQEWLALYIKHEEPILEMFDTIKEVFGDAFKVKDNS